LPRDGGAADVIWREVEPCFVFHPMNAFEDADGRVVVDVVRLPQAFANERYRATEGPPTLDRWVIDPRGGPVKEARLDDRPQEFPRLDERRVGKPYRYGYSIEVGPGFRFEALLKHDLRKRAQPSATSDGPRARSWSPCSCRARPTPRRTTAGCSRTPTTPTANRSDVVILDARDFTGEPVRTIHLPRARAVRLPRQLDSRLP
jgi:carotenoid cleavage dioxygenase